ncbi:ras family-domain-containing protein [Nemania serpens]|nr:ras family-domain-containing protein [Nemania serpens]
MGAGGVGKSCLTAQFVHNEWIESYDPTIEDSYRTHMTIDFHRLSFIPGSTDKTVVAMRDLYMKTGQGFLLVFSITSPSSLEEIAGLRDEIIRIKDDDTVPIVICGNKADLEEQRAVPRARGFDVSQRWGAPYYETSARNKTNVDEVFTDLCRQILRREDLTGEGGPRNDEYESYPQQKKRRRRHHRSKCIIL